jgi:ribosomal protein S18 acetylase RimI-like enzyme
MKFQIDQINDLDREKISALVKSTWGGETIVVHNQVFDTSGLMGLKAVTRSKIIGFLHYRVVDDECEILTFASIKQRIGVGSALLAAVEHLARSLGCQRIHLTTTNDNLHALGFYQRRGYKLTHLFPGQVKQSRMLKPSIPEIGDHNIPIRDELRLEKDLA